VKWVYSHSHISLNHYKSQYLLAEGDCSKALELEPENGKALYRRALARKGLGKFNEGLKDIRQLMVLEPNNNTAKKEEKVIHDMYLKVHWGHVMIM
jgi:Flp pilus assembly protein TadD